MDANTTDDSPTRRPHLLRLFVAALAVTSVLASCASPTAPESRPHVIIVVLDACRPDKLGCYGFDRGSSPIIDQLAADPDSVVFERHYVQADWTKPSTASLFTGMHIRQHRVALGHEPPRTEVERRWSQVLPDELQTLAEQFDAAGYDTLGVTRIPHLLPKYGFAQGFDEYLYLGDDRDVSSAALSFASSAELPIFAYLHYLACHNPFPLASRDPAYMSEFGFPYDEASRQAAGVDFTKGTLNQDVVESGLEIRPDDVRFLNLLYESQLRTTDETVVGPFLAGLKEQGIYDDALIVVTADHGHELFEHGGFTHGHALWEEIVHVPLIVKFPRGQRPDSLGPRYTQLSRAIDLYPSLLGAAGIDPPELISGVDLFEAVRIESVLSERDDMDWVLIRDRFKVFWNTNGAVHVFDLTNDPGEQHDLSLERKELVAEAIRAVAAQRKDEPATLAGELNFDVPEPTQEELEALRSLGYVN